MNRKQTGVAVILLLIFVTPIVTGQDRKQNPFDPPESTSKSDNPFDPPPPVETEVEKMERILKAQQAFIDRQTQTIEQLQREKAAVREREQILVTMSLETVYSLLQASADSDQLEGLRILQGLLTDLGRQDFGQANESQFASFITENFGRLIDSDSPQVRMASIRILQQYPFLGGIHFGYQTSSGFWHPVNNLNGQSATLRRDLLEANSVYHSHFGELRDFFETLKMDLAVEFDHDHQVDLDSAEVDVDLPNSKGFEVLDAALRQHGLGYAVVGEKILIRPLGIEALNVQLMYNIRGLRTAELDADKITELITESTVDSPLKRIIKVDQNRLLVTGTESQHRTVSRLLGLFIAPSGDPEVKTTHPATAVCNQALLAIQNLDYETLASLCSPRNVPRSANDREEFAKHFIETKKSLPSQRTTVSELRVGRSQDEIVGLIGVAGGEAFVISVVANPDPKSTVKFYFNDVQSPDENAFRKLKLIEESHEKK